VTIPRYSREDRVGAVNRLLRVISTTGRSFFRRGDNVAYMEVDARGRIWFVDAYTRKRIYTHYNLGWRGFTEGGTLQFLVKHLRDFIQVGKPLPAGELGPWPGWFCGGDLWGYGADMAIVRKEAADLGITEQLSEAANRVPTHKELVEMIDREGGDREKD